LADVSERGRENLTSICKYRDEGFHSNREYWHRSLVCHHTLLCCSIDYHALSKAGPHLTYYDLVRKVLHPPHIFQDFHHYGPEYAQCGIRFSYQSSSRCQQFAALHPASSQWLGIRPLVRRNTG